MLSTLLLVYDAEDRRARRLIGWVGRHDRRGRVVTFPYTNLELVRMAPELAGLPFQGMLYVLDLESREVRAGMEALPSLLKRLPTWSWAAALARIPVLARLLLRFMSR